MKKILAIVVLLAVAGAAALPAVIGPATEKQLRAGLNDMSAKQGVVETKVTSYERTYRGASAIISMALSDEYIESIIADNSDAEEPMTAEQVAVFKDMLSTLVSLELEIEHGPILTQFAKGVGLNSYRITPGDADWLTQWREAAGVDEVLKIVGKTGLSGNSDFDVTMPAFEINADEGQLIFSGLAGTGTWTNGSRRFDMDAGSDSIRVNFVADNGSMSVRDMSMDIDFTMKSPSLSLGTSGFNIASFDVDVNGEAPVAVENFGLDTTVKLDDSGELVDIAVIYGVDKLVVEDMTVSDATVTLELNGLTPEVLAKYQQVASNPVMDDAQIAAYQELLYDVLKVSPQLNIGPVKFKANDDTFDSIMKVSIDGDALPDRDSFNVLDIGMWMSAVTQSLDIRATEGLVDMMVDGYMTQQIMSATPEDQQIDAGELAILLEQQRSVMLEQLLAQGMITRDDNGYAVDVDFDKGEMTVNGNPFPIEALLGP